MTKLLFVHQGFELCRSDPAFVQSLAAARKTYPGSAITVVLPHDGPLVSPVRDLADEVRIEPIGILRKGDFRGARGVATATRLMKSIAHARANIEAHDLTYINTAVVADHVIASRWSSKPTILRVQEVPTGFDRYLLVTLVALARGLRIYDSEETREALGPLAPGLVVRNGDGQYSSVAAVIDRALQSGKRRRVVFCGTRGVPANYGGFETAVDEISKAFIADGTDTEVICRSGSYGDEHLEHQGRRLTYVPGSRRRVLDTVASSFQTGAYLLRRRRDYSHAFWFNNANLPGILMTRLAGIPTTVNTDGLEWRRAKWSKPLKAYYFASSWLIARTCPRLVSDSRAIQHYYRNVFRRDTHFIPYGGPPSVIVPRQRQEAILASYGVTARRYFLQITRLEPDNLPLQIAQGFLASGLGDEGYRLIIIGLKDLSTYVSKLCSLKGSVSVMKAEYDPEVLWTLRTHCFAYAHGNSVGGTNPALLEAMSTCPRVLAIDSPFSHEVLGPFGAYFRLSSVHADLRQVLQLPDQSNEMKRRIDTHYRWDAVSSAYRTLMAKQAPDYEALIRPAGCLSSTV